ncbi:MAG TPA: RHS repeat-associated core domain-containing protein [Polyangiaceae bacterium]|nr:RHS repeat-associated core domain-containing protein [Polyangiaceae bacterium]
MQYDPRFGAIIRFEDFNGVATTYQYDALGRITGIARPGDSAERPTVCYAYELAAPLSRVVTTNRTVSGSDEVTRSITMHDGANRPRATLLEGVGGQLILSEVVVHDARGEARRKLRPRFVDSDLVDSKVLLEPSAGDDSWRDAAGRGVRTRSHAGRVTKQSHSPLVTRSWDAAQADPASSYEHTPIVETRDGLDRVIRRELTLGGNAVAQQYTWSAAGELTKRIDAEGHATSYLYDGRGRRVEAKEPNAGTHRYIYDASDNLVEHRYPDQKASHFEHDLAGRTVREDWDGDGQPEVSRLFDEGGANTLGRLVRVEDPSGSTTLTYDDRGRVTRRSVQIGPMRYDTIRQYDAQDRESLHVYPDGSSVRLRYDGRGLLARLGRDAVTLHHDADATETVREYSTGVRELFGYDEDRRLNAHKVTLPDGAIVQHIGWTLDAVGNVLEQRDLRSGVAAQRSRSVRNSYDNLYRLVRSEGAWGHASSEYSVSGRLLSRTASVAALNPGGLSYDPARPHAVAKFQGRSFEYDARGRLVSDGERTLEWDGADHVVSVATKSGATLENTFAADGTRVTRVERSLSGTERTTHFLDDWSEVVDGKLVRYLVVDGKRVARLSETNGVTAAGAVVPTPPTGPQSQQVEKLRVFLNRLWAALGILFVLLLAKRLFHGVSTMSWSSMQRALGATLALGLAGACTGADADKKPNAEGTIVTLTAADTLLLSDRVGSLTEITDGAGESQGSSATYSFGETRWDEAPDENRVFASTPRDRGVGLDLMEARYYAPNIGAFLSPDPLLLDSPEQVAKLSPSHTAYSYAAQNPSTLVDRDGREPDGPGAHQELKRCTAQRGCSSAELQQVQEHNRKGAEGAGEGLLFAATVLDGIALARALPAAVRAAPKLLRAGADGVRQVVKKAASWVGGKSATKLGRLESLGGGRWRSTAGLVYGQGSKHGNRIKHVLDHASPTAGKNTHSVFSVDRREILGVLDEAWLKRGTHSVHPQSGNWNYRIDLSRRVGAAGETAVNISVRPGTSEVITAFPVR